jgi:hypothetical protein
VKYCLVSSATEAGLMLGVNVELSAVGRGTKAADPDISFFDEPPRSTPLIRPAS